MNWTVTAVKRKLILKIVLPLILLMLAILVLFAIGFVQSITQVFEEESSSASMGTNVGVTDDVLRWQLMIETEMTLQQVDKGYLPLILALIMQESGGQAPDVMQSSESIGLQVNTLQPADSIHYGIAHFKASLVKAGVKGPQDMDGIKLMLQGYNFGTGFIDYVKKNGGKYTKALAVSFSQMQAAKLGWPKYGDVDYVEHVLRYLGAGDGGGATAPTGGFASAQSKRAIEIALQQQGKPYVWGAIGPDAFDCSGLIIYCFQQAGIAINGRPTTATMFAGNSNFKAINRSDIKNGDLVMIAFGSSVDHVGIYIGDGKMVHAATDDAPLNKQIYTAKIFGDSYWESHIRGYRRVQ
ncbi:C40 family peptidase [Listeria grandensis]|uniref:C40 family peptidase n=1 Tax=Listeria grandensis TaxID=1494963 RepID=A0A7X0Y6B9_9LIST|nr:bifunctional lytic transglycosylase/C40 family peptidase [Listeria grandensis]MBC1937785.1 C40 family peptidase [Listeria grandensis]